VVLRRRGFGRRPPRDTRIEVAADPSSTMAEERAADGGTYTLCCGLSERATITVGALGALDFPAGWYAYTGTALGPGGFARVERHRELASGERDTRHWHVDYLLGHPAVRVDAVARTPGADRECAVSEALAAAEGTERVLDFGASDCDCAGHLVRAAHRDPIAAVLAREHERFRDG
jgi:endonuclease-3